jgi:hypothetical protein
MTLPPRFGVPGLAAVLGLLLALGLTFGLTPAWQAETRETLAETARAPAPPAPAPAPPEPSLPEVDPVHPRISDLLDLAREQGMAVQRVQQQVESVGPRKRVRLTMTAQASYAKLRAFIDQALQDDPGLALGRLHVQRPDEANRELQADLQWLLLLPEDRRPRR